MQIILLYLLIQIKWIQSQKQTYYSDFTILPLRDNFNSQYKLVFESKNPLCLGTPPQCVLFNFNPSISTMSIMSKEADVYLEAEKSEEDEYQMNFVLNQLKNEDPKIQLEINQLINDIENKIITNKERNKMLSDLIKAIAFDSEASETFFLIKKIDQYWLSNELKVILFQDVASIGSIFTIFDLYLISEANDLIKPEIGLLKSNNNMPIPSFIEQLYSRKIINDLIITINFFSTQTGRIYVGMNDTLQSLLNDKQMIEIALKNQKVSKKLAFLNNIYIGNQSIENNVFAIYDESIGFIQIPIDYMEKCLFAMFSIEDISNLNLRNCQVKNDSKYIILIIKKKYHPKLKTFHKLSFQLNDNYTLTLKKQDTFREFNHTHMILTIAFVNNTLLANSWIIGHPIIQHYIIQHNLTSQIMRLYKKDNYIPNNRIIMIFIGLSSFSIIASCFLLCKLLFKKLRKNQTTSFKLEEI